ncbi:hypothetical protein P168DRAFT_286584 [Aspergillus campestris IBT 28561]|uniref:Uncharacterized protein n=1 Tax=Aspergillus campestris (strain IBT 28561) TaxID=1392248 RepID=A0A2I1DF18_ASPC2|nr:uncharacterized protein P168DRAFT_286584 [Aspergillus campestris IBT 28561]PKY08467.1 hypothetical protein P168DRAFT_286584 [Aspergillus campestris IBT 28561]
MMRMILFNVTAGNRALGLATSQGVYGRATRYGNYIQKKKPGDYASCLLTFGQSRELQGVQKEMFVVRSCPELNRGLRNQNPTS